MTPRRGGAMSACNLHNEVIVDILSRLPVKSLCRFRCVCKPWLAVFADPKFIADHIDRNQCGGTILVHSCDDAKQIVSLLNTSSPGFVPHLEPPFPCRLVCKGMDVVGSINGMVCLSCPPLCLLIALWNPATKQYRYIPRPNTIEFTTDMLDIISVGFAFDSVGNDYKVIRIVCFNYELGLPARVEVYSVNAGAWREIKVDLDFKFFSTKCAVVVKGVPYWPVCPGPTIEFVQHFLWFDVCNQVFRSIPQPLYGANENSTRCCAANFKDSLALLVYSEVHIPDSVFDICNTYYKGFYPCPINDGDKSVTVYVGQSDGSSWKKLTFGPMLGVTNVVGCSKNGKFLLQTTNEGLILYDPDTEEIKDIPIDGTLESWVCSYSESLIPIRGSVLSG